MSVYHLDFSLTSDAPLDLAATLLWPSTWLCANHAPSAWLKQTESALSDSEKVRCQSLPQHKKIEYLSSRTLLRLALSAHFAPDTPIQAFHRWQLHERDKQAPLPINTPQATHISLSHCRSHYAIALAADALGVDIERHRQVTHQKRIARRIFSESQQAQLAQSGAKPGLFFDYWTQAEARYKAYHALGQAISIFDLAHIHADPFQVITYQWQACSVSLAYQGKYMPSSVPAQCYAVQFTDQSAHCEGVRLNHQ